MVTIKEISQKAGVSIATVSKVLNGKPGVHRQTAETVRTIAKEMQYRPNQYARNLKKKQHHTIGIITEDLAVFNTPMIVDGIAEYCECSDFHYILGNLRFLKRYGYKPADTEESVALVHAMIEDMLSKQVDGIIYIGQHSHVVVSLSGYRNTSFVCAYCCSDHPQVPSIVYDDKQAAFDMTELLIRYGHEAIGVITGPLDSTHTANRLLGHQSALYKHSIPYDPERTLYGDWERASGYARAKKLINQGVTAIAAQNDLMASGVMDYCHEAGIEVGKTLALTGFDNREISAFFRPALATVALPLFEIGYTAAEVLIEQIKGVNALTPHQHLLRCKIIERDSLCHRTT